MRSLTACAALLMLAAGCDDVTARGLAENAQLATGQAIDRVRDLEERVGALPDPSAMTMPLAARLDALEKRMGELEARKAAKVPHLVAIETGADFGPFAGWDRYYHEKLGEYVAMGGTPVSYFSEDCSGEGFVETAPTNVSYILGPDGTFLKLGANGMAGQVRSQRRSTQQGPKCEAGGSFAGGKSFTDTGIAALSLSAQHFRVELR